MDCRRSPPFAFDRAFAIFPYHGDCRKALAAYKFGGARPVGRFFADTLLATQKTLPDENAVWVPVPPRPGKLRKSGWDQVEFLAQILKTQRLPVSRCLRRLRSDNQKALGREGRLENLQGKIRLKAGKKPPETAIVFDDVFTTGATLNACSQALKAGGTKTVFGLCLFYG
jgi:ComF family protein